MTAVVQEIDRSSVPDRESFRAKVIEACEPVVLRGLCRDWPATRAAERSWEELAAYLLRFDLARSPRPSSANRAFAAAIIIPTIWPGSISNGSI